MLCISHQLLLSVRSRELITLGRFLVAEKKKNDPATLCCLLCDVQKGLKYIRASSHFLSGHVSPRRMEQCLWEEVEGGQRMHACACTFEAETTC